MGKRGEQIVLEREIKTFFRLFSGFSLASWLKAAWYRSPYLQF